MRVLIAALALASCYRPHPDRCQYYCANDEQRSCPDGLTCNSENICARSLTDTCGGIAIGMDAGGDATPLDGSNHRPSACTLSFGSAIATSTTPLVPYAVAVGLLDGVDALGDLAVTFVSSAIFNEYTGNGDGTFVLRGMFPQSLLAPVMNVAMVSLGSSAGSGVAMTYDDPASDGVQEFFGTPGSGIFETVAGTSTTGSASPVGIASAVNSDDGTLPNVISVTSDETSGTTYVWSFDNSSNDAAAVTLQSSFSTQLPGHAVAMATGDIDNSTRTDVVVVYDDRMFQVVHDPFASRGSAQPADPYLNTASAAALAPLGGSGLDLVIATASGLEVAINENNGQPDPFSPIVEGASTAMLPTGMAVADFNNDGYADVAIADAVSDQVLVFESLGNGTFAPAIPVASSLLGIKAVATGDLDGDALPDLVVTYSTGFVALLNRCH